MSGWSSAQSRIKHLGKKSQLVEQSNRVSVIYFDEVNGERVKDWPPNPAAGVLCVPRQMTADEWVEEMASKVIE